MAGFPASPVTRTAALRALAEGILNPMGTRDPPDPLPDCPGRMDRRGRGVVACPLPGDRITDRP